MKKNRKSSKNKLSKKIGLAPGSLVYVGDMDTDIPATKPTITLTAYNAAECVEYELTTDTLTGFNHADYTNAGKKVWLNIHGVHDAALIKQIGDLFHLHPLVQEDILNTQQRPKIDEYDDYVFLKHKVLSMIKPTPVWSLSRLVLF